MSKSKANLEQRFLIQSLGDRNSMLSVSELNELCSSLFKQLAETKAELEQAKQCLNGENPHWTTLLSSALNPKEP